MGFATRKIDSVKSNLNSLVVKHKGTDNATILRGIAALSVVVVHYDGFGARNLFYELSITGRLVNFLINMGVFGPIIFFVASGFALSASYARKPIKIGLFIFQRFFRLWPLYFIVLMATFAIRPIRGPSSFTLINLSVHLSFLDPFSGKFFTDDPVGVLSSIPIEFWWSLSIPIIFIVRRKKYILVEALILLAISVITFASTEIISAYSVFNGLQQSQLLEYGAYFYLGNFAWHIRPHVLDSKYYLRYLISSITGMTIMQIFRAASEIKIAMVSLMFLVFLRDITSSKKSLSMINNLFIAIGTICYSIYLWHYPILRIVNPLRENLWLYIPITFFAICITSILSYLFIEIKGIEICRTLGSKLNFLKLN